jgi:hypothetical protein
MAGDEVTMSGKLTKHRVLPWVFHLPFLLLLAGCDHSAVTKAGFDERKFSVYKGLTGQTVGVMVWADRGIKIDWPSIQLDLASRVQDMLSKLKVEEFKGTTWPVLPASIVRYQRDHPGIEALPITDVAPKLGVSRLLYVEIESFSTRGESSLQLYRGNATASVRVLEIEGKQSNVVYEDRGIRAIYPQRSPPEGVPGLSDPQVYQGELSSLAAQIARRFVTVED